MAKFSKPVECLALGYLGAALRAEDVEVTLIDGMLYDWNEYTTAIRILESDPNVIGITCVLDYFPASIATLTRILRDRGFTGLIVVGGHAVSFMPAEILAGCRSIDAVVSGEGEEAICAIARAAGRRSPLAAIPGVTCRDADTIIRNLPHRNKDLNALPLPLRDLTPAVIANDGLIAVSTSRGCFARCSFCSIPRFYGLQYGDEATGGWLSSSVERCVGEIVVIHERFGVRELLIVDDEFIGDVGGRGYGHERAVQFGRRLREAGCHVEFAMSCRAENVNEHTLEQLMLGGLAHVFVGLEAGTDEDLRLYGKGHTVKENADAVATIRRLGLSFQPGFMLFNHRSTLRSVVRGLEFLQEIGECKPSTINSAVDPHFGAPLTADMRRRGAITIGARAQRAECLDPAVATVRDVAELCADRFRPFMGFIARIQSAVTYEWRRKVPGRSADVQFAIDAFEARVNAGFTSIVIDAARWLDSSAGDVVSVVGEATERLNELIQDLTLAQALLVSYVGTREGAVRYWSQQDVIAADRRVGNADYGESHNSR